MRFGVTLCLLILLMAANCQYRGRRQGYSHPNDDHNVGMRYQSASTDDENPIISGMIKYFLDELKDIHIDEYETEDAVFTNIDIHLNPPPISDILFKFDESDNSLVFVLRNVGVDLETDMAMHCDFFSSQIDCLQMHAKLKIENLSIDLKTLPFTEDGHEKVNIQYHLHLKDADVKADITTVEGFSGLPEEVVGNFMPFMGDMESSFKIAATDMVDQAFEDKTEQLIHQYFDRMSTKFPLPKTLSHRVVTPKELSFDALPLKITDEDSIIIDFDSSSTLVKSSNSVSDRLKQTSRNSRGQNNDLVNVKGDLNKHHVFISPQVVQGVMHNLDLDDATFMLSDQKKLQEKVRQYFGNDVELECYNHERDFPEYRSKDDAIVGDQTVKCVLHPKGQKFDSLYEIDLKLTFNIHPQVAKDGKSLKPEFGSIQATSINTHDKTMEIQTTVSDKMDMDTYVQIDPFSQEMLIPFLMNSQFDINDSYHTQNLEKFRGILKTPNLIDIPQLERNMFRGLNFPLPVPPGTKFTNSQVKVLENGVIDVSGDLETE